MAGQVKKIIARIFMSLLLALLVVAAFWSYWLHTRIIPRDLLHRVEELRSPNFSFGNVELLPGKRVRLSNVTIWDGELGKVIGNFSRLELDFQTDSMVFPIYPRLKKVLLEGGKLRLNAQKKTVNGLPWTRFAPGMTPDELNNVEVNFAGKLILESPLGSLVREGKLRVLRRANGDAAVVDFGSLHVRLYFDREQSILIGEYEGNPEDLRPLNLFLGIPDLFRLETANRLRGGFEYDWTLERSAGLRGSVDFDPESRMDGAAFALKGVYGGVLSWEYQNGNQWKLSLSDAVMTAPLRGRLSNMVLSQSKPDVLDFDGEMVFHHGAFLQLLGLQQARQSALLRHRIIGTWSLADGKWELSRIDAGQNPAMFKGIWGGAALSMTPRSIKLNGAASSSESVVFDYEIDFTNGSLQYDDRRYLVSSDGRLTGSCSFADRKEFRLPAIKGVCELALADGMWDGSPYRFQKLKLSYENDRSDSDFDQERVGFLLESKLFRLEIGSGRVWQLVSPEFRGKWYGADGNLRNVTGNWSAGAVSLEDAAHEVKLQWGASRGQGTGSYDANGLSHAEGVFSSASGVGDWGEVPLVFSGFSGELKYRRQLDAESQEPPFRVSANANELVFGEKSLLTLSRPLFALSGNLRNGHAPELAEVRFDAPELKFIALPWEGHGGKFRLVLEKKRDRFDWNVAVSDFYANCPGWGFYQREVKGAGVEFGPRLSGVMQMEKGVFKTRDGNGEEVEETFAYRLPFIFNAEKEGWELRNGSLEYAGNFLTGASLFLRPVDGMPEKWMLQFAGFRNGIWDLRDGTADFASGKNGMTLETLSGMLAGEPLGKGVKKDGMLEFSIAKFDLAQLENSLKLPLGMLSGDASGVAKLDPAAGLTGSIVQELRLAVMKPGRLKLGEIEKFAMRSNPRIDDFALAALADFNYRELEVNLYATKRAKRWILQIRTVGRAAKVLPFDYLPESESFVRVPDAQAIFDAEVEIQMDYAIQLP